MSQNQEVKGGASLSFVPTPSTLRDNPYLPPQDGRCLINDLPTELLSQIFLMGAEMDDPTSEDEDEDEDYDSDDEDKSDDEDEEDKDGEDEDEKPSFEVTGSHVCKLWRDVAINTPALWSSLNFSEGPPYTKSAVYLERSKGSPLDLTIDVTKDEDSDDETDPNNPVPALAELMVCSDELEAILKLIIPHVWHWRLLELMVSDYVLMHSALTQMAACPSAPMLEVLELYHYEEDEEGEEMFAPAKFKEQNFVLFNGNAPRLTHVALWGVHLDWAASTFLSGLTELELAYHAKDVRPPFKDVARILRDSPEMGTLTICQSGPTGGPAEWLESMMDPNAMQTDSSEPQPDTTISLPSLKNLVIAFLEPEYAKNLVERLVLPNLKSLAIDLEEDDGTPLLQTLTRPSSTTGKSVLSGLQALKVAGVQCQEGTVIVDMYAALTNLVQLNLNFGFVSDKWFDVLVAQWESVAGSGKDPLLPRLETLTTSGLSGKDVRKLIEARKAMNRPVKTVFMNQMDELEEEDEQWIKDNVDEFDYFEGSDEEDILEIVAEGEEVENDQDEDEWEDMQ
ncbi:uncharacterized protein C8Q71DRAFT_337009 [Rhodofomes roseus]|uniref:Uncharacterized protein n=1 Tax=Rhodofomes roseus TaxID=34475 RepID=A0A4Y9Y8H9_9APHY|nr:uncharacterized protein C8Q71DRAFT_337009 [Rhodofomes roseus]KAH9841549.1 hypothetical protein C8Q71DRAFT_337009 [Rhodofomes roseus]TFY58083.1 hypothetical protein EVJ58_g6638 [Rhodofomes roseus]